MNAVEVKELDTDELRVVVEIEHDVAAVHGDGRGAVELVTRHQIEVRETVSAVDRKLHAGASSGTLTGSGIGTGAGWGTGFSSGSISTVFSVSPICIREAPFGLGVRHALGPESRATAVGTAAVEYELMGLAFGQPDCALGPVTV